MSQQQRDALDQLLRDAPLDLGGDVAEQRVIFEQMMAAIPVPDDVATSSGSLGGIPVIYVDTAGADPERVIFYLHGGAYAIGTAASSVGLAADLARRAGTRLVTVDYRLAPEHRHPAAIDDAVAAYRGLLDSGIAATAIAVAGESAGAGLAAATLVALKHVGLPQPTGAVLMSPWADLTLSGDSISAKAAVDPALTPEGLARRAVDYVGDGDPTADLVSPIFADLTGLPPLLIQAGSHEILLDDATGLAARAAAADVTVRLEITPRVPHVFQGFAAMLDEGDAALTSASEFMRAHLADPTPREPKLTSADPREE
jgi:monoterpene epsilon-lactone hydrolase